MFRSIQHKIILPAVALIAVSISVVAMSLYSSSYDSLRKEVEGKTLLASSSVSQNLKLWLRGFESELTNLSAQANTKKALGTGFLAASGKKAASKLYTDIVANNTAYQFIGLAKSTDEFVSHSDKASDFQYLLSSPYFKRALNENVLGFEHGIGGGSLSGVYIPVVIDGDVVGVLLATIELQVFADAYFSTENIADDVVIALLQRDFSTILSNTQASLDLGDFNPEQGVSLISIDGKSYVTGAQLNEAVGIAALVAISSDEVLAGIRSSRNMALILVLLAIVITGAVLSFIVRSIVKPIKVAEDMFKELSSGQGDSF